MKADFDNWLMVFLRVSAMLPSSRFSVQNFPVQLRLALAAIIALLVGAVLPAPQSGHDIWDLLGLGIMAMEVGVGLLLGFAGRMIFYALDIAGVPFRHGNRA